MLLSRRVSFGLKADVIALRWALPVAWRRDRSGHLQAAFIQADGARDGR
jgi:hypothetical protein